MRSQKLEISGIETRGIILSRQRTRKDAEADLRLCCSPYGISRFSHDVAQTEEPHVRFDNKYCTFLVPAFLWLMTEVFIVTLT